MTEAAFRQFGIIEIGDTLMGIAIEHLSEVFHVRKQEHLPQEQPLLRGGIELRGQLVPVLNLPKIGRFTHTNEEQEFGIILQTDQRLLAVFVDQVVGITSVDTDEIQHISQHEGRVQPLFHDFFTYQGRFVSLLDVSATFALPGIFTVARHSNRTDQSRRVRDPMLTFAAGGALYSVPAVEVYAAIHKQNIEKTALTIGPCLGEITYHGRRIPVLCPVQILGLGTRKTNQMTEVVALRFPDDLVIGFAVDAIHKIGTFADGLETSLPIWQAERNFISKIMIRDDSSQVYVIDLPKLHAAKDLQEIATLSKPEIPPPDVAMAQDARNLTRNIITARERFLVVDAGERLAIPISQVNCIVEQPQALTKTDIKKQGFQGYFSQAHESIALFDLCECMGRAPIDNHRAKILLTGKPGHQVGYLVDRVVSIEMSEWCEKPSSDPANRTQPLVQIGAGANAVVLPMCRLPDTMSGDAEHSFRLHRA
ncbi:chemotaxis protein CheW [Yoonia algicola]|uniref:Chemotaxis protein CheW n=1 Tax=Yoonia algicola TaxID=3137368 RepID=A0AAN0MAL1_9RHOB